MNQTAKLPFLPTDHWADGVDVDVVNTEPEGKAISPFKASKIVVKPGFWSPLDNHEVKECWLIASGNGVLVYNDNHQDIGPGDVLYYDSFNSHKVHNNGAENLVIFSLWWNK